MISFSASVAHLINKITENHDSLRRTLDQAKKTNGYVVIEGIQGRLDNIETYQKLLHAQLQDHVNRPRVTSPQELKDVSDLLRKKLTPMASVERLLEFHKLVGVSADDMPDLDPDYAAAVKKMDDSPELQATLQAKAAQDVANLLAILFSPDEEEPEQQANVQYDHEGVHNGNVPNAVTQAAMTEAEQFLTSQEGNQANEDLLQEQLEAAELCIRRLLQVANMANSALMSQPNENARLTGMELNTQVKTEFGAYRTKYLPE